jgi:hypothetical protein
MPVARSSTRHSTGHAAAVASGASIKSGEPGEALRRGRPYLRSFFKVGRCDPDDLHLLP